MRVGIMMMRRGVGVSGGGKGVEARKGGGRGLERGVKTVVQERARRGKKRRAGTECVGVGVVGDGRCWGGWRTEGSAWGVGVARDAGCVGEDVGRTRNEEAM